MTANCVPVVSRDVMSSNGVIHSLEKAMKPVTSSLMELVAQREDLTTLKTGENLVTTYLFINNIINIYNDFALQRLDWLPRRRIQNKLEIT